MVDVGDGTTTSFWYDAWHNEDPLAERFSAMHSHCTRKNVSVEQVGASGSLDSTPFVPRLSHQATAEFNELHQIVIQTSLTGTRDKRRGLFCLGLGKLDSGSHYRLLQSRNAPPHPAAKSNSSFGYSCMAEFSVEQLSSRKLSSTRLFVRYAI
jgi:hypothetical protein